MKSKSRLQKWIFLRILPACVAMLLAYHSMWLHLILFMGGIAGFTVFWKKNEKAERRKNNE
jgi:hypothetical protein